MVTFLCLFFNTGFILMLVNADLSEQPILGLFINQGSYPDFNSDFFKTVGSTLIGTLLFNVYFPLLYFLMQWSFRALKRFYDRKYSLCNEYNTRQTAMQPYIDLYSGPVFMLHYKYSSVLNISFVTMMFGYGIPMLFPIAAVSFLVLYCLEKGSLYYSYRLPPMYDHRLSEMILSSLLIAPIFYLAFGFWMCSSNQILSNEHLTPVQSVQSTPQTGHIYSHVLMPSTWSTAPAWPLLIMTTVFIMIKVFGSFIEKIVGRIFPSFKIGDIVVDEDIDNYWASIDKQDKNWSIKEE